MANSNSNRGLGLGSVLFVVFFTLKLCEVIDWAWVWVAAPIWIPFSFRALILLLCFLISPKGTKRGIMEGLGINKHKDQPRTMNFGELCDELGIDKSEIGKKCGK